MKFNKGNPPHTGWWLTERDNGPYDAPVTGWRWWNGKQWSILCYSGFDILTVTRRAQTITAIPKSRISWSDFWPKNARVPRIDHGY